jgi:hypothetical protein
MSCRRNTFARSGKTVRVSRSALLALTPVGLLSGLHAVSALDRWLGCLALIGVVSLALVFLAAAYVLMFTGTVEQRRRGARMLIRCLPFLRNRR